YVPDSLPTHRDINVHEYLDFFARAYGLKGPKRRQVVEDIEEFTNLTGIREKFLIALSKGMKQRVSVARALLHDPPVLIMDEPAATRGAARAAQGPVRPGQGHLHQLPHPDRAGRDLHRRCHYRAWPHPPGRHVGPDPGQRYAAPDRADSPPGRERSPG